MIAAKQPRSGRGFGVAARITALSVSGVFLLGILIMAVTWFFLDQSATEQARDDADSDVKVAWAMLRAEGSPFRVVDGQLLAGDRILNGNDALVDKIKDLTSAPSTIFMKDVRVATNIRKADGTRAVGTQLDRGPVYDAIFTRKAPYRGEAEILGETYLTAYDPILDPSGEVIGALFVGSRKADFLKSSRKTLFSIGGATAIAILLVGLTSVVMARRSIAKPLKDGISAMESLARGDLSVVIPEVTRADEFGHMLRALAVFKDNALEKDRLATSQRQEQEERALRREAADKVTADFTNSLNAVLGRLTSESDGLRDAARSMTTVAAETSRQTTVVASAAEQASMNVETVAAAAEELAAAEAEISRQIAQSSAVAQQAADQAKNVNSIVASLSQAAGRIGDIVKLINDIASQTNLLALNATIEAARAGEAGKGFAVVASEVKNLANQTAKATDEIIGQITAVQSVSKEAVDAIGTISQTIQLISEGATAIASAVEEQTAATREIARNVQEASSGTREVTRSIVEVREGASTTGAAAQEVSATAEDLSAQSAALSRDFENFLDGIRKSRGQTAHKG